MTKSSPLKTPKIHQINFQKLSEINRAIGTEPSPDSFPVGESAVDLQLLYSAVKKYGGYEEVCNHSKGWENVGKALESSIDSQNSSHVLNLNSIYKNAYEKYLRLYEKVVDEGLSLQDALDEINNEENGYDHDQEGHAANGDRNGNHNGDHHTDQTKPPAIVIQLSEFSKHAYKGPNPDEDGKDEKYLNGGFLNRITLAIRSCLPNEQDWAMNKLIKLTYQHHFYIGYLPGLSEALLDQTEEFFSLLRLNTSPKNFETSLVDGANSILPDISNPSVFYTEKGAVMIERTLQVFHIIRNMSFMNENAVFFVRDHRLLTALAKSLALPPTSYYTEIQQHALDIFENISYLVPLRGPSDFYLACLLKLIFGSDKARILGSIKSLIKLTLNEKNEKVLIHIDTALIQRLLQLLLVPDEDLALNILEFFYLFTNISPDAGLRIASAVRFNVLKVLFKFIHWKGQGMEVYRSTIPHLPKKATNIAEAIAPPPKAPPPNLPETAVDHFHAAMWIQAVCERDPASSTTHEDFYSKYSEYCGHYDLKPILQMELLKLIVKIVGESSVSNQPPLILGLRPKRLTKEKDDMDVDDVVSAVQPVAVGPVKEFRVGYYCGFPACHGTDVYLSAADLWKHVIDCHSPMSSLTTKSCPWNHCQAPIKNPSHFLSHLKTHIIPDAPVEANTAKLSTHSNQMLKSVPATAIQFHHGDQHQEDLKGIPLTALLILRNMARNPQNHKLFGPFENDLACLLTSAKFGKSVCSVFAELK